MASAASSAIEVPVFIDTSLGTHIAISVSPDLTAAEFKRKFESMHSDCYPEIGNIKVNGLMFREIDKVGTNPEKVTNLVHVVCVYYELGPSVIKLRLFRRDQFRNFPLTIRTKFAIFFHHRDQTRNNAYHRDQIRNFFKVKKKSYLYHLPESMPIKHAFQGSKGSWFCYTEACPSNNKISSTPQSEEVFHNGLSENRTEKNSTKSRIKKRDKENKQGSKAYSLESESESVSVSVSGIIKKYFSVYDEVTSVKSRPQVPKCAPKTPPAMTSVRALRDLRKCSGVGNGVILAANHLGISSNKKPVISLCKYKGEESSSHVRHPVFEIGEE